VAEFPNGKSAEIDKVAVFPIGKGPKTPEPPFSRTGKARDAPKPMLCGGGIAKKDKASWLDSARNKRINRCAAWFFSEIDVFLLKPLIIYLIWN